MNQEMKYLVPYLLCLLVLVLSGCNQLNPQSSINWSQLGPNIAQAGLGYAQNARSYNFPAGRPSTFQAFKDRYRTVATSPEGAVRMYFDAVYSYIDPGRKAEGAKMLRYSMHEGPNWEGSAALSTFVSRLKNPAYHHIFRSFAQGTSPENNYSMDPDNYQLMFVTTRQETDYVSISIRSSGADNPRLLQVQQEDGLWYLTNNHGTYSEVRRPASQIRRGGHDADLD